MLGKITAVRNSSFSCPNCIEIPVSHNLTLPQNCQKLIPLGNIKVSALKKWAGPTNRLTEIRFLEEVTSLVAVLLQFCCNHFSRRTVTLPIGSPDKKETLTSRFIVPSIAELLVWPLAFRHKQEWHRTPMWQAAHPALTCAAASPAALISLALSHWLLWTAWYHPAVSLTQLPGTVLWTWRCLFACHCDLQRRSGLMAPPVGEALHKLVDSLTSLHTKKAKWDEQQTAQRTALVISGNVNC